jgi:hypothetical protein
MELNRSIVPSDWAYVLLKKCKKCGVRKPVIPQIKTVSLLVESKSSLDSFFNDPVNKSLYCPHSGLGIYRALSSFGTKENEKKFDEVVEDNRLYKGPLGKNYSASDEKIKMYPWFNVKRTLFTGDNLLVGNVRHNKVVAQELCNFFLMAECNQFDAHGIVSKRWPKEFIADIYQASLYNDSLCEQPEIDVCDLMASTLSYEDSLLFFAMSNDGLTCAVSLNRAQDNLLLLKNKAPELLVLAGGSSPIVKAVFSKNNAVLVTVSSGFLNDCSIWDVKTGKEKLILFCVQDIVSTLAVSDDGSLVALFGWNLKDSLRTLNLWDGQKGKCIASVKDSSMPDLASLEFGPNNKWLVGKVIDELDYLLLWIVDVTNEQLVPITQWGPFSACAFSPFGHLAACADYEGRIYVLDIYNNAERIKAKEFVGGIVRVLLFDPLLPIAQNILFARVYDSGVVYSVWDFGTNSKKDFFLIPSSDSASATEFTSITFSESYPHKLLLGASNAFVLGDWIRR